MGLETKKRLCKFKKCHNRFDCIPLMEKKKKSNLYCYRIREINIEIFRMKNVVREIDFFI